MHQFVEIEGCWINFAHVATIEVLGRNTQYSILTADRTELGMLSREQAKKALNVLNDRANDLAVTASGA